MRKINYLDGQFLFDEIVKENANTYAVECWIRKEIIKALNESLKENNIRQILTQEEKLNMIADLCKLCPDFLLDINNGIYLKLLHLYEKEDDNKLLYYALDRFTPSDEDKELLTSSVNKITKEYISGPVFKDIIQKDGIYDETLYEYYAALSFGTSEEAKKMYPAPFIKRALKALNSALKKYDIENIVSISAEIFKGDYDEELLEINKDPMFLVADLYCTEVGLFFSNEEKQILKNELAPLEQMTVSNAISRSSNKKM